MAKSWRLKKLINWSLQGPIAMRLLTHFIAYNLATLALILACYGLRTTFAAVTEDPISTKPMTFWQQAAPVMISMFVMTPFMVWDLMTLTNRIAGPLFRFETILKDFIKSGTLKPATLRNGDLLTDFQKQFNEFTEAMHALYPETKPVAVFEATPESTTSKNANLKDRPEVTH